MELGADFSDNIDNIVDEIEKIKKIFFIFLNPIDNFISLCYNIFTIKQKGCAIYEIEL